MYMKKQELVLAIVFIVYLLVDVKTPTTLAGYVDTFAGNAIVWGLALLLFSCCCTPLSMLGLVVAYVFIQRSNMRNFMPSESSKHDEMSKYNEFPFTLEEEAVSHIPEILGSEPPVSSYTTYRPTRHLFIRH
jgi:hypothetical protein